MKYFITLFLLILFVGITSLSQLKQSDLAQNDENSLLWKISGNGLQQDSYLLGTMHSVGQTFLDSIPGFKKAFSTVKQIAIEFDIFTLDSIKRPLKEYVYMPQDITYESLFCHKDFCFVDSFLRKGIPQYFIYKPMFWSSIFSSMLIYQNIRRGEMGMDRFILLIGHQNNKKIYFMETLEKVDQRTDYLDSLGYSTISLKSQAAILKVILQHPDSLSSSLNSAMKSYKKQKMSGLLAIDSINNKSSIDLFALSAIEKDEIACIKEYQQRYFETVGVIRNEKWLERLLPMINRESSLIAVGAMHLIGNDGLIAKLRKLGYIVEPIR